MALCDSETLSPSCTNISIWGSRRRTNEIHSPVNHNWNDTPQNEHHYQYPGVVPESPYPTKPSSKAKSNHRQGQEQKRQDRAQSGSCKDAMARGPLRIVIGSRNKRLAK